MRTFKKQLNQLAKAHDLVNPDRVWVEENKKRLMLQIGNMVGESHEANSVYAFKQFVKTFVPSRALRMLRPVFTVAMVFVLAIAGWAASVSASFNSLPGDVLWNVKVAAEKTQIAFSTTKEEKIKKQLEYTERRVEEVKMVFENGDKSTDKHRTAAKKELEKVKDSVRDVVKTADEAVRDTVKTDPAKAVQLALAVENRADDIATGLDELKEVADKSGDKELVEQVVQTVKETTETAYIPVQSVLEASKQPEVAENQKIQDEVKQLVSEKLQGVLDDSEKVKQKAQGNDFSPTSTRNSAIDSISTTTSTTGTQVNKKTLEVENSAQEVRGLIEEGKLNEAFDRIKNLDQITNDAEAILTKPDATENKIEQTASSTIQDANSVQDNSNTRESTIRNSMPGTDSIQR